jgi:hypothetical protein
MAFRAPSLHPIARSSPVAWSGSLPLSRDRSRLARRSSGASFGRISTAPTEARYTPAFACRSALCRQARNRALQLCGNTHPVLCPRGANDNSRGLRSAHDACRGLKPSRNGRSRGSRCLSGTEVRPPPHRRRRCGRPPRGCALGGSVSSWRVDTASRKPVRPLGVGWEHCVGARQSRLSECKVCAQRRLRPSARSTPRTRRQEAHHDRYAETHVGPTARPRVVDRRRGGAPWDEAARRDWSGAATARRAPASAPTGQCLRRWEQQRARIHSTLITFGKPCPVTDLFGVAGRQLLERLEIPSPGAALSTPAWI